VIAWFQNQLQQRSQGEQQPAANQSQAEALGGQAALGLRMPAGRRFSSVGLVGGVEHGGEGGEALDSGGLALGGGMSPSSLAVQLSGLDLSMFSHLPPAVTMRLVEALAQNAQRPGSG
jgi:hypothetical protein